MVESRSRDSSGPASLLATCPERTRNITSPSKRFGASKVIRCVFLSRPAPHGRSEIRLRGWCGMERGGRVNESEGESSVSSCRQITGRGHG